MPVTMPVSDGEGSKPQYGKRVRFVSDVKTAPCLVVCFVCLLCFSLSPVPRLLTLVIY